MLSIAIRYSSRFGTFFSNEARRVFRLVISALVCFGVFSIADNLEIIAASLSSKRSICAFQGSGFPSTSPPHNNKIHK